MRRVKPLSVKSPNWRTRSVKELIEDSPGSRRVEIQNADGNPVRALSFDLRCSVL
ncbi:MAG: DUF2914 domain-containing protein [Deltaproteobacteria bacterium]|jgi:hypothetical protein|nr:DUF2914 domain-containing protein [Deltaproteobacteria bacterium]MBW2512908.1 DUF2914 domain-containing protein [Deltaproteobacteria bacterium]